MSRWSKLQTELYKLIEPKLNFQMHCTVYPMHSQRGSIGIPRYWITLNREIIFDYPRQFIGGSGDNATVDKAYPYITDISDISVLVREYIDTSNDELLSKDFDNDQWGLIDILRAADRRIGNRRLEELKNRTDNKAAQKVIAFRQSKTV